MRVYKTLLLVMSLTLLTGCEQMVFNTLEAYAKVANSLKSPGPGRSSAMSVSVSSDGRYVISAHRGKNLYLWDIEQRRKTRIARNVNIYSAYFVKGSDVFIWQDLDNQVHVQSVKEGKLFSFDYPEPTYGHLMTQDLQRHIASGIGWGIHVMNLEELSIQTLKSPHEHSFTGFSKVLNLSLSADEKLLVTAGSAGPYDGTHDLIENQRAVGYRRLVGVNLWSMDSLEPIAKLPGNSSKTHASISPDGQWVVSGDENGQGRYWNTKIPEQRFRRSSYRHGIYLDEKNDFDVSGLIPSPEKINSSTIATGFIWNNQNYLHISFSGTSHDEPFAVLFEAGNPWPIQYFDLGTDPWPSTREYSRNLTVATAPEAGILVTGQHSKGGINVYRFDAEALTLERIWVGH